MKKKEVYLVNTSSRLADSIIDIIKKKDAKYISIDKKSNLNKIVKENLSEKIRDFIICGGDGTINQFINSAMQLSKSKRDLIRIGIIPCGKANDFANLMNIPKNIGEAIEKIYYKRSKKIDLIKVNSKFLLTGGGIGLPAEVIEDLNKKLIKKSNFLIKWLAGRVYFYFALKKMILGYNGLDKFKFSRKEYHNTMGVFIMNQSFIGKKFKFSPNSNNCDGYFEWCVVKKTNPIIGLYLMSKAINGSLKGSNKSAYFKSKKIKLSTNKIYNFMADGEIINSSKDFDIKIIPKALSFIY